MSKEVVILGAGVAGLSAAKRLAERGDKVTVFQPDVPAEYRSIYTTFQVEAASLRGFFSQGLVRPVDYLRLLTATTDIDFEAPGYYMIDYPNTLRILKEKLPAEAKVEFLSNPDKEIKIEDLKDGVRVITGGSTVRYDSLIDCSGQWSVTRKMENPLVEYVYGGVYKADLNKEEMILSFISKIGGTCWTCPSILGDGYIDIVVSGWGWKQYKDRFIKEGDGRLKVLCDFLEERGIVGFSQKDPLLKFSGTIRSQRIDEPKSRHIYTAGDAGGMTKPKTGDGFRWAMLGGEMVADAVSENLSPAAFHRRWKKLRGGWKDGIFEAITLTRLKNQMAGDVGSTTDTIRNSVLDKRWLKEAGEEFFVSGGMDLKLLIYGLTHETLRRLLVDTIATRISMSIGGVSKFQPFYPFPELKVESSVFPPSR